MLNKVAQAPEAAKKQAEVVEGNLRSLQNQVCVCVRQPVSSPPGSVVGKEGEEGTRGGQRETPSCPALPAGG